MPHFLPASPVKKPLKTFHKAECLSFAPKITFTSRSLTQASPWLVDRCILEKLARFKGQLKQGRNGTSVSAAGLHISCFSEGTSTHYSCHFNGKKQGALFLWLNINMKWMPTKCCQWESVFETIIYSGMLASDFSEETTIKIMSLLQCFFLIASCLIIESGMGSPVGCSRCLYCGY